MIAALVGVPEWDVLMVGDGSGTGGWRMAGGWACVTIERQTDHRSLCWAAWSTCDIHIAELSAYLQAMIEFDQLRAKDVRRQLGRPIRVLVVTDNQPIVMQSTNGLIGGRVGGSTNPIWAALRQIVTANGISMTFRFAPRRSTMLNVLVDRVAERARKTIGTIERGCFRPRPSRLYVEDLSALNPKGH